MIRHWRRLRSSGAAEASQVSIASPEPPPPPPPMAWRSVALQLGHETELPPELMEALVREVGDRAAVVRPGWPRPALGRLRLCSEGLPDWWVHGGNLLLLGDEVDLPQLAFDVAGPAKDSLLVLAAKSQCYQVTLSGENNLVVVEESCMLPTTGIAVVSGATVLIGEATTSTFLSQVDARNGGAILVGRDNMWAAGVRLMTDDMHAIRDRASGRRLNVRGGRIVIEPHVWLCERVIVMGGSTIETEVIVGISSIVKNVRLLANTVCVGTPARVVRKDVTWSRDDAP